MPRFIWMRLLPLVLAAVAGCANLDGVRAFAKDGSAVAAAARKDVDIFKLSCAELKAEQRVLAYAQGRTPAADASNSTCDAAKNAVQAAAASMSVQILVKYHETLAALAGDERWNLATEIEALGSAVKGVKEDGQALVSADDADRYRRAFSAVAGMLVSALREREARTLLQQDFDWPRLLQPLRFWYGGADGQSVSLYSNACRIVRTDWILVQGELEDYTRCDRRRPGSATPCEPLTASTRLVANEARMKAVDSCAPGPGNALPEAALARVRLIDSWIAAHEEMRRAAFDRDPRQLRARLATLRDQVDAIRTAFQQ